MLPRSYRNYSANNFRLNVTKPSKYLLLIVTTKENIQIRLEINMSIISISRQGYLPGGSRQLRTYFLGGS